MHTAYIVVTTLTALAMFYSASFDFTRPKWVAKNMERLRVPESKLSLLGGLKIAGGIGILAGIPIPLLGIGAAGCLIGYFVGAIVVTLRAKWFAHLPMPAIWLGLSCASLALRLIVR